MSLDQEWLRVYQSEYSALCSFAQRLLGPPKAQAEDIVQQTGLRILELSVEARADIRNPRAFIYQVLSNLARDHLRARVTQQRFLAQSAYGARPDDPERSTPGSDVVAVSREQLLRTQEAIEQLPPQAREVVLLTRVEGLSHQEAAERMGIQPKTVENHLARALKRIHEVLSR